MGGRNAKTKVKPQVKSMKANACARAGLSCELANFKAIARHIIKNDARLEYQAMFRQHGGGQMRRLTDFAIFWRNNQPSVQ